jgi:hypothetical protein
MVWMKIVRSSVSACHRAATSACGSSQHNYRGIAYRHSSTATKPFYVPTMTEKRVGEGGRGGRASEAGVKVALFGGSGFLGNYVSANLGECAAYALLLYVSKRKHS